MGKRLQVLASPKGVNREVRSEVRGTAKVGTEEHDPDTRLRGGAR